MSSTIVPQTPHHPHLASSPNVPSPPRPRFRPLGRLAATVLLLSACVVFPVSPTAALTINLTLSPGSLSPAFDPGAVKLGQIMQAAADHWESIIADEFTTDIVYGYFDLSSDIGKTCFMHPDGTCLDGAGDVVGALPNQVLIAVDTTYLGVDIVWFFDPSPTDHSEFAMQQVLYRDLRTDEKSNHFNNTGIDLLEVGYWGSAATAAPAAAKDGVDMLSTALHEIGHALGLLNELQLPDWNASSIDLDPQFVYWNSVTANKALSSSEHLRSSDALMNASTPKAERHLPSAVDVFAIAAAAGWQEIRLPRRDFWGGLYWNAPGTWAGNSAPTAGTDAWVRSGSDAYLIADGEAHNLVISGDSQLLTYGFDFEALGYVTVEQGEGAAGSRIEVDADLLAGILRARDGGTVDVRGGHAQALAIETEPGGTLSGYGNATMWVLDNDGRLAATDASTLIINTIPGGLDLDGNGELGEVEAVGGNLLLADPLSDAFDGVMTVGGNRSVEFASAWSLGENGQLHLNGSPDGVQIAHLEGGAMTLGGALEVSGRGRIDAPLTVQPSALVHIADDSTLELQSVTEFTGGSVTGLGTLRFNGPTTVTSSTTLNPSVVDLDGQSGNTVTSLDNSVLNLQVDSIEAYNNTFDGALHVYGWLARLNLQLNDPGERWTLNGNLHFEAGGTWPSIQLTGSDVIVKGLYEVDGLSRSTADLDLIGHLATVDAQAQAQLAGGGVNIFRHTSDVTGPGQVVVMPGTTLQLENGFSEWMQLRNQGALEPGVGIGMGRLWIYTQTSSGHLDVELGGTTPATEHDQLQAFGNVTLDGGLHVSLDGAFIPSLGDAFVVLTSSFGIISGTWDPAASSLPALPAGLDWQITYQNKSVTLRVVSGP